MLGSTLRDLVLVTANEQYYTYFDESDKEELEMSFEVEEQVENVVD
jgi:hypothetical protein